MTDNFSTSENSVGTFQTGEKGSPKKWLLFVVTAVVLLADYVTKLIVEDRLALNTAWAPFPEIAHIFRFTHVSNTGAAFGLFPSGSSLFMIVAIIVSIVIVIYNQLLPAGNRMYRLALGLQLGGALGNLISRIRLGHVTDFFDFGPWPVFNIADLSVVSGVIVLAFLMLSEERQRLKNKDNASKEGAEEDPKALDSGEDSRMLWND
jgi:signal peptidase II